MTYSQHAYQEETLSIPDTLQFIIDKLQQEKPSRPAQVIHILEQASVKAEDLSPWAAYDHPPTDSYGRKMVYKADQFEIMVMSWQPGDFSAIHDHGFAQWGAVQIFGPAEHATFRHEEDFLFTLARWQVSPGDIIGVSHSLIHQMGNPTDDCQFLSLHIYGNIESPDLITGDARIFDLENQQIQRVDGGAFFALPTAQIKRLEPGPKADFPTHIRYMVELIRRLQQMSAQEQAETGLELEQVIRSAFSAHRHSTLLRCLETNTDAHNHQDNSRYWRVLNHELKQVAKLQRELEGQQKREDHFHKYADLYDALICKPCFDQFIRKYLLFFLDQYAINLSEKTLISLGCGTGLVESALISEIGMKPENIFGIDISESMIQVARERINAETGDILELDAENRQWDIAFSGLNVFHYLDHHRLEEAIQQTARILKPGGYFVGDFITPDHIRWYPNVMYSADQQVISLRTPRLIEEGGRMFQESEITNLSYLDEKLEVSYAGRHRRFLPPMNRIRMYFERAFGRNVSLYDAHSLELIPETADSCTSTRYVVVAQKA